MKTCFWVVCLVLGLCCEVQARQGLYFTLGGGFTSVNGQEVPYHRFGSDDSGMSIPRISSGSLFTTAIDGGNSLLLRMGYNILGYASVESCLSGHGNNLSDASLRQWAAHWHIGTRVYPSWHWQNQLPELLRPLEASLFLGWGVSYQVYVPTPSLDEIGWDTTASLRFGVGLEYFLVSYFKVSLDYYYINAPYDDFIFNYEDSEYYPVDSDAASTGFHQFCVSLGFQFGPAGVRATEIGSGLDL